MTPAYVRDVLLFPRDEDGRLKLAGSAREISRREAFRLNLFLNGVVGWGKAFEARVNELYKEYLDGIRGRAAGPGHPGRNTASGPGGPGSQPTAEPGDPGTGPGDPVG